MDKRLSMTTTQKYLIGAAVLILLIIGFAGGWYFKPCPCNIKPTSDTVIIIKPSTDTFHTLQKGKPEVRGVRHSKVTKSLELKPSDSGDLKFFQNGNSSKECQSSSDTVMYYDRFFKPDTCEITLSESVSGNQIISRELKYKDLHPDKWKIVTNTVVKNPPSFVLYARARAELPVSNMGQLKGYDAGGGLSLTIKDKVLLELDYMLIGQQLGVGVGYKLFSK